MNVVGYTRIINFMAQRVIVLGRGHNRHIVKMNYFFNNLLLYAQFLIRKIGSIVMMTKEEFAKILNIMTPVVGVLVLGHDNIVKMQYLSSSSCLR